MGLLTSEAVSTPGWRWVRFRSDKARLNHGVGAGSWGTRKMWSCSTLDFWPFVGFYVGMLGPTFFSLVQPLS